MYHQTHTVPNWLKDFLPKLLKKTEDCRGTRDNTGGRSLYYLYSGSLVIIASIALPGSNHWHPGDQTSHQVLKHNSSHTSFLSGEQMILSLATPLLQTKKLI